MTPKHFLDLSDLTSQTVRDIVDEARRRKEARTIANVPLPAGWSSAIDPSSGVVYFYNTALQQTQWQDPRLDNSAGSTC